VSEGEPRENAKFKINMSRNPFITKIWKWTKTCM